MLTSRVRPVCALTIALAVTLSLAACGNDAASPTATAGAAAPSTTNSEPTASSTEQLVQPSADLELLDDQRQLFASTVGSDYVVVFDVVSSASAEAGPVEVSVQDGRAVEVEYPDTMTEQILPDIPLLTVGDFFDRARAVLDDGGLIEIEFDEFYGYPTVMNLDPVPNAIDDELSIVLRSVEPTEPGFESDGY